MEEMALYKVYSEPH